ncbi:MAG: DNA polymerase III subunit delta' [Chloroflexi bacterium]|nr:DNA polymerase III subunit delta' [Chloroflexota bacterium]
MWNVMGHEAAVTLLSRSLERDMLAHAYIFVGPPRVGKTALALALAQGVNCLAPTASRPCGECGQCRRIAQMRHPDVQIIDRDAGAARSGPRTEIGIDQVRDVQHAAALLPYEGRCRVFIFQDADAISAEASNALLKLLEEPPDSVLLVLLTTNSESVLPTILSRCQVVDLNPLPLDAIVAELQHVTDKSSREALELARLSGGRIGWALEAARDPEIVSQYVRELERFAVLLDSGLEKRFAYAEEVASLFSRNREAALEQLRTAIGWWRYLLLVKEAGDELAPSIPARDSLQQSARWISTAEAVKAIRGTRETIDCLEANVNPRLALEVLMLSLPRRNSNGRSV